MLPEKRDGGERSVIYVCGCVCVSVCLLLALLSALQMSDMDDGSDEMPTHAQHPGGAGGAGGAGAGAGAGAKARELTDHEKLCASIQNTADGKKDKARGKMMTRAEKRINDDLDAPDGDEVYMNEEETALLAQEHKIIQDEADAMIKLANVREQKRMDAEQKRLDARAKKAKSVGKKKDEDEECDEGKKAPKAKAVARMVSPVQKPKLPPGVKALGDVRSLELKVAMGEAKTQDAIQKLTTALKGDEKVASTIKWLRDNDLKGLGDAEGIVHINKLTTALQVSGCLGGGWCPPPLSHTPPTALGDVQEGVHGDGRGQGGAEGRRGGV